MNKDELLEALEEIRNRQRFPEYVNTCEEDHFEADGLLLKYIDDVRITKLFNQIEKWYA